MSNIFIRQIVGSGIYTIPESDLELAATTAGLDALISGIANLTYGSLLGWVEDSGGPGGAEGTRTLNCLIGNFTYFGEECPPEEGATGVDTLIGQIESTLEADPNISSIDVQQYSLYQAPAAPVSGDKRAPVIIVGNAPAGDTDDDCDYLDTGNCAQLATAIASAGPGDDVYIRPGTYDFGQPGAPATRIVIPAGARVRGAGRNHVTIRSRTAGGDCCVILVSGDGSSLQDLRLYAPAPTAAQTAGDAILEVSGDNVDLIRVDVEYNYAGLPSPWYVRADIGLYAYNCSDLRMIDCRVLNAPKLWQVPGPVVNGFLLYQITNLYVKGIYVSGGDNGGYLNRCTAAQVYEMHFNGWKHAGLVIYRSEWSIIVNGQFISDGTYSTATRGIEAGAYAHYITFDNLTFRVSGTGYAEAAIFLYYSSRSIIRGCHGDGRWTGYGFIRLDTACSWSIIIGNQCHDNGISDLNSTTQAAHNYL